MERKGFGSVKAALEFYGERESGSNFRFKKSQFNSSEKPSSRIAELQETRRDTNQYSDTKRIADSVTSQAESELSYAKKTVTELRQWIEESNARAKARSNDLGKQSEKPNTLRGTENHQYTKLVNGLESAKQELGRLKLAMASLVENKTRAEKERAASELKAQSYSDSAEELIKEIERLSEEHVFVELARLEATREREAIEAQRQEAAKKQSATLDESREKIDDMMRELDRVKELESRLAITTSDANVLENELRQVRESDKIQIRKNLKNVEYDEESDSSALLQSREELEAAKQELNYIKAECSQSIASMEIVRNELSTLMEETAQRKKSEAKTELTIQNLNSKLVRAKTKLESTCAAEDRAESIVSNLSLALEQLKRETGAAKEERIIDIEETTILKAEVKKTESEINIVEERFRAALQELKIVNSSEAKALERLKRLSEKTMRNRTLASKHSSTITLSTSEYEYLTGCAVQAAEVADKKIAAAHAWVDALKASENEILLTMELTQSGNKLEVVRTEESTSVKRVVERELAKWELRFEKVAEREALQPQLGLSKKAARAKFRSPAARHSPRSTSFSFNRRRKVMPNLTKFFSGKSTDGDL